MRIIYMFTAFAILFTFFSPSVAQENDSQSWKDIRSWRDPKKNVAIISGNELSIEGIKCRLLGIKIPDDKMVADRARRFLELYIDDCRGYFWIYNSGTPIDSADGVPLIWLGATNVGWAQEVLVQAGLAEPDFKGLETYGFMIPTKYGAVDYDWKKSLSAASSHFQNGKAPNVGFSWPAEKAEEKDKRSVSASEAPSE